MKLIYLASPFTHSSKRVMQKRRKQIDLIGAKLQYTHRVAIFPPITISDTYAKLLPGKFEHKFEAWANIDLYTISKCDEVWVCTMDGWKESVGVQAEIALAKARKIKVRYIDPKTTRFIK